MPSLHKPVPDGWRNLCGQRPYAVKRVEGDLAGEPAVQAELMERLGLVYTNLSQFDEAEVLLDASLARRRAAFGPASAETATSLLALGRHWHERGEYERAEGLLRESLRLRLAALGPDHADTAASQHYLALTLTQQEEDPAEAEALFHDALATRRAHLGDRTLEVAYTLNSLGNLYTDRERFDEAEPLLVRAHEALVAGFGAEHSFVADSRGRLAALYEATGRPEEAARWRG